MTARILSQKLAAAQSRLAEAQAIADQLRHEAALHRLAMQAVFALEDCVFSFEEAIWLTTTPVAQDQP